MSVKQYENKAITLLKSRKFWAAVAATVGVASAYFTNQETGWQAAQALVAIATAYSLGTAIEDHGKFSGGSSLPPTS